MNLNRGLGLLPLLCFGLTGFLAAGISSPNPSRAETSLQASLTPTVTITGLLGSLQQIQYSTNVANSNGWMTLAMVRMDAPVKNFYDATASGPQRFYRTVLMGVTDTNLVWIPPGTFLMGSPTNEVGRLANEGIQTLVTLTEGFLMGRYEVRYPEMKAYVTDYTGNPAGAPNLALAAASQVRWTDAMEYCALRTDYERTQGMIPPDWAYRLPTEAEWEYSCRAGTTTPFNLGNEIRNDGIRSDANMDGRFPYPTNLVAFLPVTQLATNVGSFAPNAFGLYDMHGNVSEYCLDTVGAITIPPLKGGAVTNPVAANFGAFTISRGGHLAEPGSNCRSAYRRALPVTSAGNDNGNGFRVVLSSTNAAVLPHP